MNGAIRVYLKDVDGAKEINTAFGAELFVPMKGFKQVKWCNVYKLIWSSDKDLPLKEININWESISTK